MLKQALITVGYPAEDLAGYTPAEVRASDEAFVRQFIGGEPDGPVPFHYPARPYPNDVGLASGDPNIDTDPRIIAAAERAMRHGERPDGEKTWRQL